MDAATVIVIAPTVGHPYTIVTGPPNVSPVLYTVVIPVRMEMIVNDTAKLDAALHGKEQHFYVSIKFSVGEMIASEQFKARICSETIIYLYGKL